MSGSATQGNATQVSGCRVVLLGPGGTGGMDGSVPALGDGRTTERTGAPAAGPGDVSDRQPGVEQTPGEEGGWRGRRGEAVGKGKG